MASFQTIWWYPSKQFGGILLHFVFPSTPQLSSKLSSSKTSFPNSFLNSLVENSYYMASPL
jgi:hypothetical protein